MSRINKCGIYKIWNIISNKVYIGSSSRIMDRIWQHKTNLNGGYHQNKYLQNSWNKYRKDAFVFEILEECQIKDLEEREQYWFEFYRKSFKVYNLRPKMVNSNVGVKRFPLTEERKLHMSSLMKGRKCSPISDEMKKRLSELNLGKRLSEETKLKISNSMIGRKVSEETKLKMREVNLGKKLSDEHKRRIGEKSIGRRHTEESKKKIGKASKERSKKQKEILL